MLLPGTMLDALLFLSALGSLIAPLLLSALCVLVLILPPLLLSVLLGLPVLVVPLLLLRVPWLLLLLL